MERMGSVTPSMLSCITECLMPTHSSWQSHLSRRRCSRKYAKC